MTSSTGSPVTTTTRKTVPSHRIAATTTAPRTVTPTTPPVYCYRQQTQRLGRSGSGIVRQQHPRHLLAYSLLSILVVLCWLPDFIVALKDVSVTIPQAVKRGSNAMLTCNYDMENDTLYSVKWYKGRREFYRYTPKENPAMKVFLTQSGLNVERNLSNQSHVVLLAVPLNISGKFTCEISVEAPSFQTAMVSGEMEVVELPEEQASVTGIQPRYRIGDLVDGNCSIKYSKPAANLTWTINGIVVPPHHIKTYQIEKYEETNLESVMSAIHFMVTTQHFIKGQMRLKCTASIFDIFREEIESVIEEDRPRIMASGRSYDAHSYPHDDNGGGYEDHNESYLTYFSAPKSAASPRARAPFSIIFHNLHKLLQHLPRITLKKIKNHICFTLATFIIDIERYYEKITHSDMTTYWLKVWQQWQRQLQQQQQQLIKLITVMVVLLKIHQLLNRGWQWVWQVGIEVANKTITKKCCNCKGSMMKVQSKLEEVEEEARDGNVTANTLLTSYQDLLEQQQAQLLQDSEMHWDDCYLGEGAMAADAATAFGSLHADCQFGMEQCLAANQNVINEKVWHKHENTSATSTIAAVDDYQQQMSQTLDGKPSSTTTPTASLASPSRPFATVIVSPDTYRETQEVDEEGQAAEYAHDSFPLCDDGAAIDATKSNNANYMSRDQTLLMTSSSNNSSINTTCPNRRTPTLESTTARKTKSSVAKATTQSPSTDLDVTLAEARTVASSASLTSTSPFALSPSHEAFSSFLSEDNNCLMAFIGELLLHQC